MRSSLDRNNFEYEDKWREAVRASANTEFCKTNEGTCPLYTFLNDSHIGCDCPRTRKAMGLPKCDGSVVVCPVRHVGWPEYSRDCIAQFGAKVSGASS